MPVTELDWLTTAVELPTLLVLCFLVLRFLRHLDSSSERGVERDRMLAGSLDANTRAVTELSLEVRELRQAVTAREDAAERRAGAAAAATTAGR